MAQQQASRSAPLISVISFKQKRVISHNATKESLCAESGLSSSSHQSSSRWPSPSRRRISPSTRGASGAEAGAHHRRHGGQRRDRSFAPGGGCVVPQSVGEPSEWGMASSAMGPRRAFRCSHRSTRPQDQCNMHISVALPVATYRKRPDRFQRRRLPWEYCQLSSCPLCRTSISPSSTLQFRTSPHGEQ